MLLMKTQNTSARTLLILIPTLLTFFLTVAPSWGQGSSPTKSCDSIFLSLPHPKSTVVPLKNTESVSTVRQFSEIPVLRLMTYNVKNLFTHVGDFDRVGPNKFQKTKPSKDKPEQELIGVAQAINESNPDVIVMQEVEGQSVLEDFNNHYLNGQYQTFLTPGNDGRGIDIGFLLKKDLPLKVVKESYKNLQWNDPADNNHPVPLFSRDLPTLLFYKKTDDPAKSQPLFVVIGNHGKSKRSRPGDPDSVQLRTAQYNQARLIVDSYLKRFGKDLPLLMAGDFNTDVRTEPEVASLKERLSDVFDLVKVPESERITHTFHPRGGATVQSQLDAILVSNGLTHSILQASIYRYKNKNGEIKPLPKTYNEREGNPSDHYPIIVDISTESIFHEILQPAMDKAVGF
jgi:endonuclease/exonuclease/phosphatase family metal-dependent hydrolase